jgi:hypothetical protein
MFLLKLNFNDNLLLFDLAVYVNKKSYIRLQIHYKFM